MPSTDLLETFGAYLLLRPLGRGGMGVVYVARSSLASHPIVAVKRLRADAVPVPSFLERFEHECELALRLRHSTLVEALDAGRIGDTPYVASELIRGQNLGSLSHRLADAGTGAPAAAVIRIMADALSALRYVHTAREEDGRPLALVHRDVTPGNIIVGYDGLSRLADFGLAKSLLSRHLGLTAEGTVLGTPSYLALEMAKGADASPQTDLYGIGAVAYRLLAGFGPYDGSPRDVLMKMLNGPPPPITQFRPDLPPAFVRMLEALMAREPGDRPATAAEALAGLETVAERTGAWVEREDLANWLSKIFASEKRAQDEQWALDEQIAMQRSPETGTRVLPRIDAPLDGEGSGEDIQLPSTMAIGHLDAVALMNLDPPGDTLKSPAPITRFDPPTEPALVTPSKPVPVTVRRPTPTAERVTVTPKRTPGGDVPTKTIRPSAPDTRVTPSAVPIHQTRSQPGWMAMMIGMVIAAIAGAIISASLVSQPPPPPVTDLYERLGVAMAKVRARKTPDAPQLQTRLETVRQHLKEGASDDARVLLSDVEQTLRTDSSTVARR